MDRASADAIIFDVLKRDPERVSDAIVNVAHSFLESGRYSAEEVRAAVDELIEELERAPSAPPLITLSCAS
jgi:hypothetical protein